MYGDDIAASSQYDRELHVVHLQDCEMLFRSLKGKGEERKIDKEGTGNCLTSMFMTVIRLEMDSLSTYR